MKGTDFKKYINLQTHTDDTTYPVDDLILHANIVKDKLAEIIHSKIDEGYFEITETRSLIKDQYEYAFPKDLLLSIKKAWIKLNNKWYTLKEFDVSQYDGVFDHEEIKKVWGDKEPMFEITGRGMRIYTGVDIEDTIDGLKILGSSYPEDITSDMLNSDNDLSVPSGTNKNKKIRMPRALHQLWADYVIKFYKDSRDKPMDSRDLTQSLYIDEQQVLEKLGIRNRDASFVPKRPFNDGSQY